ncbi:MAG: hypothetical protein K0R53_3269 [Burkholderiales bacterium]|jgi:hypothetical protein|nr:hypothetical protein [Burkholderiales bacterium]
MKNAILSILLMLSCSTAATQGVPPVMRYNGVAENIYLLDRCRALTAERRAWLENVRAHAMRAAGWDAAQAAAHDELLKSEFAQRYAAGIAKERCDQLARTTDHERATVRLVP